MDIQIVYENEFFENNEEGYPFTRRGEPARMRVWHARALALRNPGGYSTRTASFYFSQGEGQALALRNPGGCSTRTASPYFLTTNLPVAVKSPAVKV